MAEQFTPRRLHEMPEAETPQADDRLVLDRPVAGGGFLTRMIRYANLILGLVKTDGSTPFTAPQAGVAPDAPADFVTKAWADGHIVGLEAEGDPEDGQTPILEDGRWVYRTPTGGEDEVVPFPELTVLAEVGASGGGAVNMLAADVPTMDVWHARGPLVRIHGARVSGGWRHRPGRPVLGGEGLELLEGQYLVYGLSTATRMNFSQLRLVADGSEVAVGVSLAGNTGHSHRGYPTWIVGVLDLPASRRMELQYQWTRSTSTSGPSPTAHAADGREEIYALLSSIRLDTAPDRELVLVTHEMPSGEVGGKTYGNQSWTTHRPINTVALDTHSLASLADNELTLPAGWWRVLGTLSTYRSRYIIHRLWNVDTDAEIFRTTAQRADDGTSTQASHNDWVDRIFQLAASQKVRVDAYRSFGTGTNQNAGEPVEIAGKELYAWLLFERIDPDRYALVQQVQPHDEDGGTAALGWNQRNLNTVVNNSGGLVSLSDNVITINTAGRYHVHAWARSHRVRGTRIRLVDDSTDQPVAWGMSGYREDTATLSEAPVMLIAVLELSQGQTLRLEQYRHEGSSDNWNLGQAFGQSMGSLDPDNIYANISFLIEELPE